MKTTQRNKGWASMIMLAVMMSLSVLTGWAADAVPVPDSDTITVETSKWTPLIIVLAPLIVSLLKTMGPQLVAKIPKLWMPVAVAGIGLALSFLDVFGGGSGLNPVVGAVLGAAGLWLRELMDQLKKTGKGAEKVALVLLTVMLASGCATSQSGNAVVAGHEFTPEQVQRDIQLVARIGAREGCKQDKNVEPYLQSAVVVLTAALNDGNLDLEFVKAALANISVKEIRSDTAQQYIADALELYQNHAGDSVSGKIDKVRYLRPALTGLRDGIVDGLAQFNASR